VARDRAIRVSDYGDNELLTPRNLGTESRYPKTAGMRSNEWSPSLAESIGYRNANVEKWEREHPAWPSATTVAAHHYPRGGRPTVAAHFWSAATTRSASHVFAGAHR
jgi:hypothetical protein